MTQVQKELFTDLTQEQSATVEGGATFTLHSIFAVRAGADWRGDDDLSVKFDGKTIYKKDFGTGDFRRVERSRHFHGPSSLRLKDRDPWPNPDDNIGQMSISDTPATNQWAIFSGNGSTYRVHYSVS